MQSPISAPTTKHPWLRLLFLFASLLLSIALYIVLSKVAPPEDGPLLLFLPAWSICFLPYFAACAYVLATKPLAGRWFWIELGVILLGALIFRLMLLPLPPGLSRDVWRYLWDARVTTHGYSPYVYGPGSPVLIPLRDILYINCRFRNIPTDYPPGAELIFIPGYLIDGHSLLGIKSLFLVFDMISCGALTWLLARKNLDLRRVIIYAWCPLPIIEFAIEGHVDVLTVTFIVLSILSATSTSRNGRILTGFFIGMATLTRLYPILLLPVVLRRRDWALLLTCSGTVLLGYFPFIVMGHGQVFGFLLTYASEQGRISGIVQSLMRLIGSRLGLSLSATVRLEYAVDLVIVSAVSIVILILRHRERISMEMATLLVISTSFAIASHIFPWYATTLLPWIAMLVGPLLLDGKTIAKSLIVAWAWYYACTILLLYSVNVVGLDKAPNWARYFYAHNGLVFKLVVAGAIVLVYCFASRPMRNNGTVKHVKL
jgi:hypothetical protein